MQVRRATPESGYRVQIWNTVDDINVADWNSLCHEDDLFMDLRMLRATAGTMDDDDQFRFVIVYDNGENPVAATCLWKYRIEGTLLDNDSWWIRSFKRLAAVFPAVNHHRILFCGMPVSAGQSNLRFAVDADHAQVLAVLNRHLEQIARKERLRCIVFKEFEKSQVTSLSSLEHLGYHRAYSLPMNQLTPNADSFEGYLTSLTSRKRWQIRNSIRKCEQSGLRLHVPTDVDEAVALYSDKVHELYKAVLGKAESQLETLPAEFFREISRTFRTDCRFCFLMKGDDVRAFGVVLFSKHVAYALYVGVDYELNAEHDLYFNAMYAMLAEGLSRDVKVISWGQTANDFKRSKLGCTQTPRYLFLKGTNFFMRTLIRLLFAHLFPSREVDAATVPAEEPEQKKAA